MNPDGTNLAQVTNVGAPNSDPSWSPDGSKIAFNSFRDGNAEIYLMNPDGTNQVNITNNPGQDWWPSWSPDGTKILFQSNRDGGLAELYTMSADGNNQTRITNIPEGANYPAWSPFLGARLLNTPAESNVSVFPNVGTSTTFTNVTYAGNTTVTTSASGPTPPSGFSLGDPPSIYDVTTTATFSGTVQVCFAYDPARYVDPNGLQLRHYENGIWVNVTTSNNTTTNVICGQVTSFSPFALMEQVTVISVDIKPGSYPNTINLGSNGAVPVAILSNASFDARTVNPSSATLASAPVKLTGKGTPMYSQQDVNGDGRLDLVVHVTTSAFQLTTTDTLAVLKGKTNGGVSIKGTDTIRVVP
jgi:TolB protein